MQKITPFLWFNADAEEAMALYSSAFRDVRVGAVSRYGEGMPLPAGTVMVATLAIDGLEMQFLNGGPVHRPTPAVSFFVTCATTAEADGIWAKLSPGATVLIPFEKQPYSEKYGWLSDKYGVSWQIFTGKGEHKIAPFLFFCNENNGKAEEAMKFYTSVFGASAITSIARYGAGMGEPETAVVHGEFALAGQPFMAMENGKPTGYGFTEGNSFLVSVETQQEIDDLWAKLTAGGSEGQCGWLKDKYGLSWQIIPSSLPTFIGDPDRAKAGRAMQAMLAMKKIDLDALRKAHDGV